MSKNLDSRKLAKLNITNRTVSPEFSYGKFYKTYGIKGFEFSADDKNIFFLKDDGKVRNIFKYDVVKGKISRVTNYSDSVSAYIDSYDGKYIYLRKDHNGNEFYDLFRFDLKTKKTVRLTNNAKGERAFICDVSPDSRKLYYSQSYNHRSFAKIISINLKTLKKSVMYAPLGERLYCGKVDNSGEKLFIYNFRDNNEINLGILDTNDSEVVYISNEPGVKNYDANFVNNSVYFLSTKGSNKRRIWKYDIEKDKKKTARAPIKRDIEGIGIYDNGRMSSISYRNGLKSKLKVYDGLFKNEKKFSAPLDKDLQGILYPRDNRRIGIAIKANSYTPSQYYVMQGNNVKLFYDSNKSGIKNKYFSKSYSTFVESFDGLKIPVHFFIPNGTSKNNRKPAIIWIHGGPESHTNPMYSGLFQFLMNNGYIIVAPNVRGSTGFGRKYQFMDNGDWGGGHIKDLVSVAKYTKKLDFVDADNLFVVGASFGGFSVMSLITQYPDVFNAAVDIFGPVDMASFIDSWPKLSQEYWIKELGADPRLDKVFNRKVSPIYHVDKISIPLQVHQGANDVRVPKAQSDMLVNKMRKSGKNVEYIVYSDEGHGFQKFSNKKKCFNSVLRFLNENLNAVNSRH